MRVAPAALLAASIRADNACFEAARRPGVTLAIHLCRGNNRSHWYAEGGYDAIAETLFSSMAVDRFLLEYDDERSGSFEPLRFVPRGKTVVLGLVSSKRPELESRRRARAAHRRGRALRAARGPRAQPAVRLRLDDGGKPAHRGRAVGQAAARPRDGAPRLGLAGRAARLGHAHAGRHRRRRDRRACCCPTCCTSRAIESVVLEARSREHVVHRVRAGVLEQGSVEVLAEAGLGERLRREALVHHGIELRWAGASHRIALTELTGALDLHLRTAEGRRGPGLGATARRTARCCSRCRTSAWTASMASGRRVRYRHEGEARELVCDFVAGCDGSHGVSREAVPPGSLRVYRNECAFAWLGVLADVAPSSARARVRLARARLRAPQPPLAQHQPAVPAGRAAGRARRLARRAHLGGAAPAPGAAGLHASRRPACSRGTSRSCAASWSSRCGTAGCCWPATPRTSCRRPAPRA